MEIDRLDGRKANQLRPLACSRNILNRAHGSASWTQGDTKVLVAVYGPKAGTKKNENPEKACIEVIWKPKSGQIGKLEREYEMIVKRTLQSICILNINPNTTTSVIVQVINDDGALLPCAINAACAALVDAGIPLKHLAVAICCCLADSGYIILDPTKLEEQVTGFDDIIPRDTLLWKLKLLKSAAAFANSRLHAVKAEVLVLASGKDNMLPSRDEAERLKNSLQDCVVRHFKDNGHTLLLEDGIGLMTVIKGTSKFRRSRRHSYASDFLPPSMTELNYACDQIIGLLRLASGSILFSTLEDGKIVRGLAGVPNEGPVILVGYHMLMGVELSSLAEGFLREKNIMVRGLAHPMLFSRTAESSSSDFSLTDWMRVFGAVPVTPSNLFKLLSTKSHVLLYPGGSREALHYKGEEYKLFWPDQQEFVRMAARFGATIVPFGVVGEDDVAELVLDYNDLMRILVVNDLVKDANENAIRLRDEASGEVASQKLFIPLLMPKIPGRFYYLFGKPIKTKGREDILKDKQVANQLYLQVKSEVERQISFLIKKRQEDPFRSIVDRTLYKAIYAPSHEVPAFEP